MLRRMAQLPKQFPYVDFWVHATHPLSSFRREDCVRSTTYGQSSYDDCRLLPADYCKSATSRRHYPFGYKA